MTTLREQLSAAQWARDLCEATGAPDFAQRVCRLSITHTRAHGARLVLLKDGEATTLAEEGRGLALIDDDIPTRAHEQPGLLRDGHVSAVAFGSHVLILVGADDAAAEDLAPFLPLVCLALEGRAARDARRGRGRTSEVVANLVRSIGGSLDLSEILTATAQSAARAVDFERAFVGLYDEVGENTARTGQVFTYNLDDMSRDGLTIGPQSFERLIRRGEPILFDRTRDANSPLAAGLQQLAPERCLIVPLMARGRPLGVLYVDTRTPGAPLGEDEVWLALALAEQASLSIDNARLYAEESRKRRSAEDLRESGAALSGTLRLAETLERLLEHAQRLFGAQACAVYELQPDGRDLRIRSALNLPTEYVLRARARVGVGVVGQSVARRERILVRDMHTERIEVGSRYTRSLLASGQYPFRGLIGLPLGSRGKIFGGLVLYYEQPLDLDENDVFLAEVFASQGALAIENARLYEEEVRRERESNVLLNLSRLLGKGRPDGALAQAAELAALAMNGERGLMLLFDETGEPAEMGAFALRATPEVAAGLAQHLGRGPRRLTRRNCLPGGGSAIIVPLRTGEQVLGLLYVDCARDEAPSDRVLQLARAVADQMALTVGQERLLLALEREEARYRLLAEGAHDLILTCDASGTINYANPATLRLLGDVRGRPVRDVLLEDWRVAFERAWNDCLTDPARGVTAEVDAGGLSGPVRLEVRLSAVERDREVLGVLLVARDLSAQLHAAEEIARRSQALEAASARQVELRSYLALFTQAQEEERRRISRELHDDTAQVLVAIGRRLDRLTRDLGGESRERAEDVRADLNAAIESVRRFARNLRPSVLDDLGLLPAVEWLASQARTPTRLEVQGSERRLPATLELTLFRVVQEALTNVDKHAGAHSAAVRVQFLEDLVSVSVADDGMGFDPAQAADLATQGHLGLMGLRERIELAGGQLHVESEPGAGSTFRFELPA